MFIFHLSNAGRGGLEVLARGCVVALALCAVGLVQTAQAQVVRVKTMEIDPAVSRLSTGELIDRLQFEGEVKVTWPASDGAPENVQPTVPAFEFLFLPIARATYAQVPKLRPQSSVMTELIRRGVAALPALLDHLTDARPTAIVVRGSWPGSLVFADHYDYRYLDAQRQPKEVNTVSLGGEVLLAAEVPYACTVGDLCLKAVENIVNRGKRSWVTGVRRMRVEIISSPTVYPSLARAARADWGGLTAKDHEESLRADVLEGTHSGPYFDYSAEALQRLLFYYPEAGRRLTESLLRRDLVPNDTPPPLGPNQVLLKDQLDVENALVAFDWDGLDQEIYAVYQKAIRVPHGESAMAFSCAKKLAGRGHDDEFRIYFLGLITAAETAMGSPTIEDWQRGLITQDIAAYRAYLAKLAKNS